MLDRTVACATIFSMYNLTKQLSCVYDAIWTTKVDKSFGDRLFSMFGEMRFRNPPFDRVPYGMCHFCDWDDMCEQFSEHLPSFFTMIDYLIRQTFIFLFGEQGPRVYRWYHRSKSLNNNMTENVIQYLVTSKKDTVERRVMLSCLLRAHSAVELNHLLANHPELLEEMNAQLRKDEASDEAEERSVSGSGAVTNDSGGAGSMDEPSVSNGVHTARTLFHLSSECNRQEGEVAKDNVMWNRIDRRGGDGCNNGNTSTWGNKWGDVETGEGNDGNVDNTAGRQLVGERYYVRNGYNDERTRCQGGGEDENQREENGNVQRQEDGQRNECAIGNGGRGNAEEDHAGSNKVSRIAYLKRKATDDWYLLSNEGMLLSRPLARRRFEVEVVTDAVKFMLDANNVQLMAWGTIRLEIDGRTVRFPQLVRTVTLERIWQAYNAKDGRECESGRKLKRTTFISILRKITTADTKQRACVDYKLHALVYENASTLKRIIEDTVPVEKTRKELTKKLEAVIEFLKYSYVTHIDDRSFDPYHNTKFSLNHGNYATKFMKSTCRECNSVFKFIEEVRSNIVSLNNQLDKILTEASIKLEQYMSHKVRAHTQERRIKEMFQWVRNGQERQRVVVFCDFKMKVEPQRRRETQLQYYGKAGMSLHGTAVFYKPKAEGDSMLPREKKAKKMDSAELAQLSADERRRYVEKEENYGMLTSFFVDHVCENDKKQDRIFTISIFEAVLYRIRKEIPEATEIVFCTDNARNYNNNVLPVYLPWVCEQYGFHLHSILHPDACCGKSCVDCHFAVSFRLLKRYILETKFDVLTPEDIVDALRYEGGIRNTFVDYIRVNRKFKTIVWYETAEKLKLIANMESPAEIRYEKSDHGEFFVKCFKYSHAFYRVFCIKEHESIEVVNKPGHAAVDKESYSTEEERIAEKERLQLEAEGRAAERLELMAKSATCPDVDDVALPTLEAPPGFRQCVLCAHSIHRKRNCPVCNGKN